MVSAAVALSSGGCLAYEIIVTIKFEEATLKFI